MIGIIIIAVALILGIYILTQISLAPEIGSLAYNITTNYSTTAVTALGNGIPWISILIVVGFAVIVLGMLTPGFGKNKRSKGAPAY
jgi:ABC-type Na+ efflux pump permease subunit